MATRTWIGGATAGSQVVTLTAGGTIGTATFTITSSGEAIATYTATSGDGANEVAQGLVSSWNASTNPLGAGVTAVDTTSTSAGTLTLNANTAGVPFFVSTSATDSGTLTQQTTSESYGPNDWNTIANWQERAVPVTDDDVVVQGSSSILYSLDQSTPEIASFEVRNYSGNIGSPGNPLKIHLKNTTGVFDYASSGIGYIDITGTGFSPTVQGTSSTNTGYGLYLTGDNFNTFSLTKGSVALAIGSADFLIVTTIVQGYQTNVESDSRLAIGTGVTGPGSAAVTLKKTGGSCIFRCPADTVQNDAGTLYSEGTGAIATATLRGGSFVPNSSGTITDLDMMGGTVDFTQTLVARTVTNATLYAGASLKIDQSFVTLTNDLVLSGSLHISASAN